MMNDVIEAQARPVIRKSIMVQLVLATGIVSSDRAAERILLALALAGFIMTGVFLFSGNSTAEGLSHQDIERIIQLQVQGGTYNQ